MTGYAVALVGAQYGSEGKGVIAGAIAHQFRGAVRVGGPNAGHSLYVEGQLYKMRSVPCAWVNADAVLMVGAGAVINPTTLAQELSDLYDRSPATPIVVIDPQAVLIDEGYEHAELATIRETIGSTAEGVGEARVAKVQRRGAAILARDYVWNLLPGLPTGSVEIGDVASLAADLMEAGGRVMLEGTQGSGLSLHHGIYPYVTSSDTNASGIAAEAGIPPSKVRCTHLVIRSHPIRVAGNSGPIGDELQWSDLLPRFEIAVPEQTTVTHKTRRIAEYDEAQVDRAVMLNDPCGLWLTFGDYLDPSIRGTTDPAAIAKSQPVAEFRRYLEARYNAPVLGVTTGPGVYRGTDHSDWMVAQDEHWCMHGEEYGVRFAGAEVL